MRALLLLIAILLAACETTYREGATVTSASGQRLCAKHRVPLVPLHAWQAPTHGHKVYLVHQAGYPYYGVAEQYCPNHIPEHIAFHSGDIFQERTTVYYCPLCEKEFWDRLRVRDQRAAIEFAQYMLWISSDMRTKAPYDVTFQKGVWTVKCLLADGRPATVKIGEDGREISTQFRRYSSNRSLQPTASRRE
jgi:hypothetical protein